MTNFITIFAAIVAAQIFATLLCFGVLLNDWMRSKVSKLYTKMVMKIVDDFEEIVEDQEKIES